MKTRLVKPEDLTEYTHPAIILFRSIELLATYENTKNLFFKKPSLDLGCGDGYLADLLFKEQFTYGLDNGEANDVNIAIEKKRYQKILIEDAQHMSLPDNTLNFIFCNSVIEHIPDNEAVLQEVSRTLKPGGDFVFTSPSHLFKEWLYINNPLYIFLRQKMLNHYHTISLEEWTKRLKKHNMKIINHSYYITRETNQLWDQIALETRLSGLLNPNAEQISYQKYIKEILKLCQIDQINLTKGASLFIHAVKT